MRFLIWLSLATPVLAQTDIALSNARLLEREGDGMAARTALRNAARSNSPAALDAWAEFLDRHRDPEARSAYEKLLAVLPEGEQRSGAARRLIVLDLLAGDNEAAQRHLASYRPAGMQMPVARAGPAKARHTVTIPGPLASFSRMAAIAPDMPLDDVLPALARNIVTTGYQASHTLEGLEPTEYLKLLLRYLSQARELETLAGPEKVLRIETCESTQTADLLRVLGYRMRGTCGSDVVLETVNGTRAFLTIDSGFPLAQLEQSLRTSRPFTYDFRPTVLPVLFGSEYWMQAAGKKGEFVDEFVGDPAVCRLYIGFSKLDDETAEELRKAIPAPRIRAFSHVLDFYGGMFEIRSGKAVVPGGARAQAAWKELVGRSPDEGAAFFERLLTKDDGWLASFYDAVARVSPATRDYLFEQNRIQRIYAAVRGRTTSPGPARPVFRANSDMLLLTRRLVLDRDGRLLVPGGLDVWKTIVGGYSQPKEAKLPKPITWRDSDDLLETLFALTRRQMDNEPLRIFFAAVDIERNRTRPLEPGTVLRLAKEYKALHAWYPLFAESRQLSDATMLAWMDAARRVEKAGDEYTRMNTAGTLQALTGLWQIFVRQGSIPADEADASLAKIIAPFASVNSAPALFDAGRAGVKALLAAARAPENGSMQDHALDLLAGAVGHPDSDSHSLLLQEMMQIFEAQKLVPLDTLFQVADVLEGAARGEKPDLQPVAKFQSRVAEVQPPRSALSSVEKSTVSFGYWSERHIDRQRKTNLRAALDRAAADREKLGSLRGDLAGFLRDTLVGLNYAHYAPPGGQILLTNPVFVRTHDFIGMSSTPQLWHEAEVHGSGWPSSAGGRLVGSLAGLPYALAEAEQNFLIPSREQALIWGDLVPQMLISAKVSRWWNVTPAQTRWVSLHINQGESLLAQASVDAAVREAAMTSLRRYVPPARAWTVEQALADGRVRDAADMLTPAEAYLVAAEWWRSNPDDPGLPGREVREIARANAAEVTPQAISRAFGTPKPVLSNSFVPELLNLPTYPTLMGYSSRIMAESWESNNLYYAALADELHVRPSQLNILIPQWTQQTVENIFATHLEDWPALLRSLRSVGTRERARMRAVLNPDSQKASLN